MNKLTPFGKAVRKYRVDRGETQADVADAVGVQVTFWSAIETGKKNVPDDLLERLIAHFGLADHEAESLRGLALQSRKDIKINMEGLSDRGRELVVGFARKFEEVQGNEKEISRLRVLLEIGGK
jgi:transcriptional regulator with XRE-family HTH domain